MTISQRFVRLRLPSPRPLMPLPSQLIITFGPWGWSFLCVLLNALHANRSGERTLHLCVPLGIGIIGFIIASVTENLGGEPCAPLAACVWR